MSPRESDPDDAKKKREQSQQDDRDRPTRGSQKEKNQTSHGPADPHDDNA
ncbi:hypothetical protein [Salinisphaera sp. Q1T1-3]|nr:hypothetical protein [Salinisphaera sp. Q1T1-3]